MGSDRIKGAIQPNASKQTRGEAGFTHRPFVAKLHHTRAPLPHERATPEEIRTLVHRSSAYIVCFEFETPVPTRRSALDFVTGLYNTSSRCVEASQTLATSLQRGSIEDLLGLPLEEILPRRSGYGDLFAHWHNSGLSGQSFEVGIVQIDTKHRLFNAAIYARASAESLARFWVVLREIRGQSASDLTAHAAPYHASSSSDFRRLSGIAHDLNNYLTLLRGQVETALDTIESSHPGATPLREAARTLVASSNLARQLFSPQLPTEPILLATSVPKLLHGAINLCRPLIPSHIILKSGETRESLSIQSSPPELQQALINLILNARDALEKPGEIVVSAEAFYEEQQPFIAIKVRDNGPGIPRRDLDRIFEPYFTTKAHRGGTGLGLSNVKASVESFGGSIQVRSTEGIGTEFSLIFPAIDDRDSIPSLNLKIMEQYPLSVLVAEDDDSIRNVLLSMVARLGHRAFGVTDGEALISMIHEGLHTYDVVIVDDSMPKARGIDLLPGLRKLLPEAQLILISGDPRLSKQTKAADGKAYFLSKPFGTEDLCRVLLQATVRHAGPYRDQSF